MSFLEKELAVLVVGLHDRTNDTGEGNSRRNLKNEEDGASGQLFFCAKMS